MPCKVFMWTTETRESSIPVLYISACIGKIIQCQSLWGWYLKMIYSPLQLCCKNPWIIELWFYYTQDLSSHRHLRVEALSSASSLLSAFVSPTWWNRATRLKSVGVRKRGMKEEEKQHRRGRVGIECRRIRNTEQRERKRSKRKGSEIILDWDG